MPTSRPLGGGQADGGNRSAWSPQPSVGRQQQLQEAAAAMLQQALLGLQGMQPAQPVVEILLRRKPATSSGLTGQVRDVMGRCPALADASEAEMDARPVARPLAAALAEKPSRALRSLVAR